jgi:tRNA U38,U39,U40 pseudouridine synthase TruA
MQRYHFRVQYKGNKHCGWASGRNSRHRGVIDSLERNLKRATNGLPPVIIGAGRTDAKVNATGQHAHVDIARQTKPKLTQAPKRTTALMKNHQSLTLGQDVILDKSTLLINSKTSIESSIGGYIAAQRKPTHTQSGSKPTIQPNTPKKTPPTLTALTHSLHDIDLENSSSRKVFFEKLQQTTIKLIEFTHNNPDICFSNSIHAHNPSYSLFLQGVISQSCIKDEYQELYNSMDTSTPLFSHSSTTHPVTLPSFRSPTKGYPSEIHKSLYTEPVSSLCPTQPTNHTQIPHSKNVSQLDTIISKRGANLFLLQQPLPVEELLSLWNMSLHGDFGVPSSQPDALYKNRHRNITQLNDGSADGAIEQPDQNDPKRAEFLKQLRSNYNQAAQGGSKQSLMTIWDDSDSDDNDNGAIVEDDDNGGKSKAQNAAASKKPSQQPHQPSPHRNMEVDYRNLVNKLGVKPPSIFGTVAISNLKVVNQLNLPKIETISSPSPLLNSSSSTMDHTHSLPTFKSLTTLPTHQNVIDTPSEPPIDLGLTPSTYRNPMHARYDAYKRQYRYRLQFSPSYDPFDHALAPHLEFGTKLYEPRGFLPPISQMSPSEQQLFVYQHRTGIDHHNNPSTIVHMGAQKKDKFDYFNAFQIAKKLTGKHNFNAFRNSKCQALSPVRRVDDITFSFEPTMSQLITNGVEYYTNDNSHPQHPNKITHLSTSALRKNKNGGYHVSFAQSCRASIADIISHCVRHLNHNEEQSDTPMTSPRVKKLNKLAINPINDILLQNDHHYEELLQNLGEIERLFKLPIMSTEFNLTESERHLMMDILQTTQYLNTDVLSEWFTDVNHDRELISNFVKQNTSPYNQRDVLTISYTARAFLHNQVRIMTGAILQGGQWGSTGHRNSFGPEKTQLLLNSDNFDSPGAVLFGVGNRSNKLSQPLIETSERTINDAKTAPAAGLFFSHVHYPTDHSRFIFDPILDDYQVWSGDNGSSLSNSPSAPSYSLISDLVNQYQQKLQSLNHNYNLPEDVVSKWYGPEHNLALWRKIVQLQGKVSRNED